MNLRKAIQQFKAFYGTKKKKRVVAAARGEWAGDTETGESASSLRKKAKEASKRLGRDVSVAEIMDAQKRARKAKEKEEQAKNDYY